MITSLRRLTALEITRFFFFIRILFIRITRLKSGKNKNNLRITKAQILTPIASFFLVEVEWGVVKC